MSVHASFIANTQYTAADLNQRDKDFITNGVLTSSDLIVSQTDTPAMEIKVTGASLGASGGNCWIDGYKIYNDSNVTLTIDTADASNPRIDLVVIGIDITTVPDYTPVLQVIKGTPSASPVAPIAPGNLICVDLAEIYVGAGVTTITNSNITDVRVFCNIQSNLYSNLTDEIDNVSNFPFKIKSAFYTVGTDTLSIVIAPGTGETFNSTTINTITKTTDTTFTITPVSASTTYTIYLKNDGDFDKSTDGSQATGSLIIGTVSTDADKEVTTIVDKRPLVSASGKVLATHLAETATHITAASRDVSIAGEQTISLLSSRTAKKITVFANISNTTIASWGIATSIGQKCILQAETGNSSNDNTNIIQIHTASGVYATGNVVIEEGQIKITWAKTGSPTGTVYLLVVADYHD